MKTKKPGQLKKSYQSPRLVVYGTLRRLTMGGGGINGDGKGKPKTKV